MGLPLCLDRGWAVWGGEGRQGWKGKEGQPGQGRPRGVSTPCGNRREQKSHRKPHSASEPGRAVPPARCIPWGPCCVPTPRPPPGEHKAGPAQGMGPYLSGEPSLGCSCPFPSRSLLVVSVPGAGPGAALGLGASILGQEMIPAGSCSILDIAAAGVPEGRASSSSCSAFPEAEDRSVPASGVPGVLGRSLGLCRASCPWGSLSPDSSGCPWLCPGSSPPCPGSAWAWCPCGCTCPRSGRRGRGSWAWC